MITELDVLDLFSDPRCGSVPGTFELESVLIDNSGISRDLNQADSRGNSWVDSRRSSSKISRGDSTSGSRGINRDDSRDDSTGISRDNRDTCKVDSTIAEDNDPVEDVELSSSNLEENGPEFIVWVVSCELTIVENDGVDWDSSIDV